MRFGCRLIAYLATLGVAAAAPLVQDGDRLALYGDSITYQKNYSVQLECYLRGCAGMPRLQLFQFGQGGETAEHFAGRQPRVFEFWPPTAAVVFFGMNDARQMDRRPEYRERYRDRLTRILEFLKEREIRTVPATPTAVDPDFFRQPDAERNKYLALLADDVRALGRERQLPVADFYAAFTTVGPAAKARYGKSYSLGGPDGVHPYGNGHLLMLRELLRALELPGEIGEIVYDAATGNARSSAGHRVLAAEPGRLTLESRRYPFVVSDQDGAFPGTSLLELVPFQQEFNRLILKVENAPAERLRVKLGTVEKSFSRTELARGINLAAEFPKDHPLADAFERLRRAVAAKQAFESWAQLSFCTELPARLPEFMKSPEGQRVWRELRDGAIRKWTELESNVTRALVPVRYELTITPEIPEKEEGAK